MQFIDFNLQLVVNIFEGGINLYICNMILRIL